MFWNTKRPIILTISLTLFKDLSNKNDYVNLFKTSLLIALRVWNTPVPS